MAIWTPAEHFELLLGPIYMAVPPLVAVRGNVAKYHNLSCLAGSHHVVGPHRLARHHASAV